VLFNSYPELRSSSAVLLSSSAVLLDSSPAECRRASRLQRLLPDDVQHPTGERPMRVTSSLAITCLTVLMTLVSACDEPTDTTMTTSATEPVLNRGDSLSTLVPVSDPAEPLNDAQILTMTRTVNDAEMAQSKLALGKSHDPRVKKMASMMLADHKSAAKSGEELVIKDNLPVMPSAASMSLASDTSNTLDELATKSGADFDKAYVDAQVAEHQAVLGMINDDLLPDAKDANVKGFLEKLRPTIARHLKDAQDLRMQLPK
jgi:putative membrane protein